LINAQDAIDLIKFLRGFDEKTQDIFGYLEAP
jgi:hypothetical protein